LSNPYNAPTADLSQVADTGNTYVPEVMTIHGRIGRLRYLAYTSVASLVILAVMAVVMLGLGFISPALAMVGMILVIPVIVVSFVMAKRRLNDMDRSGWWSVLTLVPFVGMIVSLVLLFYPGDKGSNDYGLPPAPNTTGVVVGAWLVVIIGFVGGIVAAIALPAYQGYVERAKAAQEEAQAAQTQLQDASQ
jgi:uncharacterized membrane protein YhaH (DUF805 family)